MGIEATLRRLAEAGRVLSTKNEAALKAALEAIQAVLSTLAKGEAADAKQEAAVQEAMALLEAELSHNEQRQVLDTAVRAKFSARYTWIKDVYQDHLIFHDEGPRVRDALSTDTGSKLYWVDFSISDTGEVVLGDPIEVRVQREYVPVTQTVETTETAIFEGDVVPLVEKAVRRDGTIPLKVIAPGWGSSGYYSPEMLERDAPKVFVKGLHMYWDHATATESVERPERSLRDLAATFTGDARWDGKGPAGPGVYADAWVREDYRAAVEELAPHIGVSINAYGSAKQGEAEGRRGAIIEQLTSARSVDFVTVPGAGGRVLELFESAGRRQAAPTAAVRVDAQAAEDTLKEADVTKLEEAERENARLREALILRDAKDVCRETLAGIEMPDLTRARLQEALAKNPPAKDGELDKDAYVTSIEEAAKEELAYLAKLTNSGSVVGLGESEADTTSEDEKVLAEADTALADAFSRMGMSESGVKIAVTGR